MSGSAWWPIDVPASRWFTEEERAASRRYHGPIQRAAVVRGGAQLVGIVAAWWWLRRSPVGLLEAVVLVLGAIAVPRAGVDAWHEFVHEPRFGSRPVRVSAFVVTGLGRFVVEGGVLGMVAWLLFEGETMAEAWLAGALAAGVAAALPVVSTLAGARVVLALHRAVEVDPTHPAQASVREAAEHFGIARPRFLVFDDTVLDDTVFDDTVRDDTVFDDTVRDDTVGDDTVRDDFNAYVAGRRSSPVVCVSRSLLDGPPDLLAHVVAHEMAHVARRHVVWSAVFAAAAFAATAFLAVAATLRWESGAARLPLLVVAAVIVAAPCRLVMAWSSRMHERRADQLALQIAPVSPELVGQLHLSDRPLLEPGLLAALLQSHPTPSERVESAARRWPAPLRN